MTDQFEKILTKKLLELSVNLKKVIDVEVFMENILYKLNELTPCTPFALLLEGSGRNPIIELVFHDIGKKNKNFLKELRYKKPSSDEYFNKALKDNFGSDIILKDDIEGTEKIIDAYTSFNWSMIGKKYINRKNEKIAKERLRLFTEGESLTQKEEEHIIAFLTEQIRISKDEFLTSKKVASHHIDDLTNSVDEVFLKDAINNEISLKKVIPEHNFSVLACSIKGLTSIEIEIGKVGLNAMLVTCHDILANSIRHIDIISRISHNSFIVLSPSLNTKEGKKLLKRVTEEANRTIIELWTKAKSRVEVPLDLRLSVKASDTTNPECILNSALKDIGVNLK